MLPIRTPCFSRYKVRGMTILEVSVAITVLVLLLVGILGSILQADRISRENVDQSAALASAHGAVEQLLRGISFTELPYTDSSGNLYRGSGGSPIPSSDTATYAMVSQLPICFNGQLTATALRLSTGTIPLPSAIEPGGLPAVGSGINDNTVAIDINNTPNIASDDLQMRLWVWIQDATNLSVDATQVRAVTLIYQWRFLDGRNTSGRWHVGSLRNMRSAAPNF